jgi:SAM-dependent methyltransferase
MATKCPLCGVWSDRLYSAVPDWEYGERSADFYQCLNCRLVFQHPIAAIAYPSDYSHHSDKGLIGCLKKIQDRLFIRKMHRYLCQKWQDLLEVGCGTGRFVRALAREGYSGVKGVDIFLGSSLESVQGYYQCIIMQNVIEHFVNPVKSLEKVHDLMEPGRHLILRTPNTDSWSRRAFGRYWAGLQSPRHTWLFNPKNLGTLAYRVGFERCIWLSQSDASTWAISFQNWLVSKGVRRPKGGVAWWSLALLPLWYPLALLETFFGKSSTIFAVLVKK